MSRVVSIEGGGDWADAGYDLFSVDDGVDVGNMHKQWRTWYEEVYRPNLKELKYKSFAQWFLEQDGVTEFQYEVFGE